MQLNFVILLNFYLKWTLLVFKFKDRFNRNPNKFVKKNLIKYNRIFSDSNEYILAFFFFYKNK